MRQTEIQIVNRLGLHARAAAKFVKLAAGFESDIHLNIGDLVANGKDILALMMLAAGKGTHIQLRIDGPDEDSASEQLTQLVADRFGEPE